jgi:hypothetical protein
MNRYFSILVALVAVGVAVPALAADPQVAHMVYFQLKDSSDATRAKLVSACNEYLSGHEGTVYYSAGVIAEDMSRDVNDQDFDVALNLVFRNKEAHDKYAIHPRHIEFIEKHKDTWANVRVFDSYVAAPK